MPYTLGDAAKATGKSKATISKAIKKGRISAIRLDSGAFSIDPSELHRVYPAVHSEQKETLETSEIMELRLKLAASEQRILDKDSVIDDLRQDRDSWRQQATALLQDKRDPPRGGFFRRFFGR